MAVFAYHVLDAQRKRANGTIVADTPWQARDQLRQRGLRTLRLHEVRSGADKARFHVVGTHHASSLIAATRELSTLLSVGVPLTEALDTVAAQYRGSFAQGLVQLRDRVASGLSLADAMRQRPDLFDEMTVAVVEVGENAGRLDDVLEKLAEFKERWQELSNHVLSALIYPALVLLMAFAVSIFLMTFVVPNILAGLIQEDRPLPTITLAVKAVSDLLLTHGWYLAPLVLASASLALWLILRGPLREPWHRAVMRLPLVGSMIRRQAVVRLATIISTLMRSGVSFEHAIQIAASTTPNTVIRRALEACGRAVASGSDIADALAQTRAFPPTVVQVFAVGQESGRLEDMLERLARDYDRQVYTLARRLTALLEPVMIVLLALIVGLIAFATMLPILEAGNVL